jgi:hypothetical protein
MTKLQTLLDKLATNSRVQSHLGKAKEAYEQKPFVLEYRETYESISSYGWIPSLLSIISSSLVASTVFPNLSLWLSVPIGLLLALGLEILKAFTTQIGFRSWFKVGKFNLILCASIGLYIASIALSSFGSFNGYQLIETSMKQNVSNHTDTLSKSLGIQYEKAINEAKENANNYFNSVSWKGKISHKNAQTYNLLLERLAILKDEYNTKLNGLELEGKNQVSEGIRKSKPYLLVLIAIALLNELVIFFFSRFKEYYLFKSNQQVEQITQSETLTINLDSIGNLAQLLQLQPNNQIAITSEAGSKIGFDLSILQTKENNTVQGNRPTTATQTGNKLEPRECVNCSTVYKPSVSWQKYCKKECNHVANDFKLKK